MHQSGFLKKKLAITLRALPLLSPTLLRILARLIDLPAPSGKDKGHCHSDLHMLISLEEHGWPSSQCPSFFRLFYSLNPF